MQLKTALMGAGLMALLAGAAWAGDEPVKKEEHRVTIICHKGPGGPEHGGPGGEHGGPADHHMMVMRMHADGKKLDANGDGTITREEFLAFHASMFDEMDKNHDGKLSADEMHGDMGPHGEHGEHGKMIVMHGDMGGDMQCSHEGGPDGDMQVHVEHGDGMEMRVIVNEGGPDGHMGGEHGEHMRMMMHGGPGGHGGGFDEMDKNKDGKISFDEFAAPMHEAFGHMDKNHDGFIDKAEWGEGHVMIRRIEKHVEKQTDDKK
jgi:Ca2+-binding EF-hand superfamily protein